MEKEKILQRVGQQGLRLVRFLYCGNDGLIGGKAVSDSFLEAFIDSGIGLPVAVQSHNVLDCPVAGGTFGPVGRFVWFLTWAVLRSYHMFLKPLTYLPIWFSKTERLGICAHGHSSNVWRSKRLRKGSPLWLPLRMSFTWPFEHQQVHISPLIKVVVLVLLGWIQYQKLC